MTWRSVPTWVSSAAAWRARACRICAELGAHYVKTYYVADGFGTVTASCPVPIVMAGGITTFLNPEPLAMFFDLFLLGEAEANRSARAEELSKSEQIVEEQLQELSYEVMEHELSPVARRLVTTCPSCLHTWRDEYPHLLGEPLGFEVLHSTELIAALIVAADGGARNARRLGLWPDVIVGDLDSVESDLLAELQEPQRRHLPAELLVRRGRQVLGQIPGVREVCSSVCFSHAHSGHDARCASTAAASLALSSPSM